ncbi:MAG: AbrB/MazE/SpoVT family DNA-binding domain-containing protein [Bacteroides sp.]|nr:AbrB/MazE/SpoVT family DNA-binding domain-containing protein [Bacillota bacterium]MCM1393839.1 AbrB/MazE/SpoVT family DNA-binding domain-containing protein [[Eubacterium] siraeum]MCM1455978.1 AbrB/MazE/SpoVT family DNA-binding domain-containing protein [Bacteroides sp.]
MATIGSTMTTAGIVRRIDELGRIVIPKEMRRTMHLKEGDEMEILSNGDALTLRKYSSFESVLPIIKSTAKLLAKATDATVLFVDTSSVTVAEGKNKRAYQSAELSDGFSNTVRLRRSEIIEGAALKDVFFDRDADCKYLVLEPVIVGGDLMGAALLLTDTAPSDTARAYMNFCVELIASALQ